jgi:hypothetical protein
MKPWQKNKKKKLKHWELKKKYASSTPASNDFTLTDTWETFGFKYRGHWTPTNTYVPKDVVWYDFVANPSIGTENYFSCVVSHCAEQPSELNDPKIWQKYK